jgi:hypothetical protein
VKLKVSPGSAMLASTRGRNSTSCRSSPRVLAASLATRATLLS